MHMYTPLYTHTSMHLCAPLTSSLYLWLTAMGTITMNAQVQTVPSILYEWDTVCQRRERSGRQMAK